MKIKLDEQKVTQAAAHLLKLRGGPMHYIKLIKLLYLADREALLRYGRPITYDNYVSMDHGPVLSQTYNLIVEDTRPGQPSFWKAHIQNTEDYAVKLTKEAGDGKLSDAEVEILEEIFKKYGTMNRWALIDDVMHALPEWHDPHGSSLPITHIEVLRVCGKSDAEATAIAEELESLSVTHSLLS